MHKYDVLVSNGYDYEYETTIEAPSVHAARAKWKKRGDWKTVDFRVRRVRSQTL